MDSERHDRRRFLQVACGAVAGSWIPPARGRPPFRGNIGNIGRSSPVWQRVREIVRSEQLGRIALCRSSLGNTSRDRLFALIDCVQFVFDEAAPVSVSAQGNLMVTLRYPGFVASFEYCAGATEETVICGTEATLVVWWDRRSPLVVCPAFSAEEHLTDDKSRSSVPPPPALREGRAIDCRLGLGLEALWT
jgi:predicted dehydrogenase